MQREGDDVGNRPREDSQSLKNSAKRLGRGSQTGKGQDRRGLRDMERWQEIQSADLSIQITAEMMYWGR